MVESNLPCDPMGIFNRWVSAGSRDCFKAQMNSAIATSALFPGEKSWSTRGTWISEVLIRYRIALRHSYCDILLMLSAGHEGKDLDIFPKRELLQGSRHLVLTHNYLQHTFV